MAQGQLIMIRKPHIAPKRIGLVPYLPLYKTPLQKTNDLHLLDNKYLAAS